MNPEFALNLVQNISEALIALDLKGHVKFWNKGAENLFGYRRDEVMGKVVPFISKESFFELETAFEKAHQGKAYTFKTQKYSKQGLLLELMVNSSPLYENDEVIGISATFMELSTLKKATFIPYNLVPFLRESKRTFSEIRDLILVTLAKGKMTLNHIATESGVNWRTVEKHITYMIGKKLVQELFSSEYIRIFELTEQGRKYVAELKERELSKIIKKDGE